METDVNSDGMYKYENKIHPFPHSENNVFKEIFI